MLPAARSEQTGAHSFEYTEELQEFLSARGIPTNTPDALPAFGNALQDPAFADEMASIVRSIFYREGEGLRPAAMAALLERAVDASAAPSAGDPASRQRILAFVTAALRSGEVGQKPFDSEETASTESAATAAPDAEALLPLDTSLDLPPAPPRSAWRGQPPSPDDTVSIPPTEERPINDKLSAALHHLSSAEHTAPIPEQPRFRPQPAAQTEARIPDTTKRPGSGLRGAYWIPGLAALLAVAAVLIYLQQHRTVSPGNASSASQSSRTAAAPSNAAAASTEDDLGTAAGPTTQRDPDAATPYPDAAASSARTANTPGALTRDERTPATRPAPTETRNAGRHPSSAARRVPSTAAANAVPPDAHEAVFLSSSGVMASHLVYAPAPGYPALAKLTHLEGQVILQVVVSREGTVAVTHVLSGPYLLRGAVEHAIRRWRYRPYMMNGRNTDVSTIVTVSFRMRH